MKDKDLDMASDLIKDLEDAGFEVEVVEEGEPDVLLVSDNDKKGKKKMESKKFTNEQMFGMYQMLQPFLGMKNMIGYAAARNSRVLFDKVQEYAEFRMALILKYGKPVLDDDGNETGDYSLDIDSENFKEFSEEIGKYANIKSKVKLFTVDYNEAIGVLSGEELLALDFMFEDKGDDS